MLRYPFRWFVCAVLVAVPVVASAQTAVTPHTKPKVVQRGTPTSIPAGPGNVLVQVLVKKDGSFQVIKVISSTNPSDNAAALEVAKSSKYKPGTLNGSPDDEYYDYQVAFAATTGSSGSTVPAGPLATADAAIHAGKYDDAKSQLQSYLSAHPGDVQASLLLGVADSFGGDAAGATAAFDKAGTIPDQYKALALQSYEKYAASALDSNNLNDTISASGHVIDLDPQNYGAYYFRGTAYSGQQNYTAAIADLQKALELATAAKADAKPLQAIEFNLAIAQLDAGQFGEAATSARDIYRDDTDLSSKLDKQAYVAVTNAAIPLANAGKIPDAVSRLESGAAAFPHNAASLTAEAAYIMATDKKPDWDKIKAEADKAITLDPNEGRANFVLGIQAAQKSDAKDALDYMHKAKASPDYSADSTLAKQIDAALNQLNAASSHSQSNPNGSPF